MKRRWDTWTIAFAGAVIGLFASLVHIVFDRMDGPVNLAYVLLYIGGATTVFAVASLFHNWLTMRTRPS